MRGRETTIKLTTEIRDLYLRSCELAERYNAIGQRADRELVEKCRGGRSREIPELERFESVFDRQDALTRAQADPAVRQRLAACKGVATAVIFPAALWLATTPGPWHWGWIGLACATMCGLGYVLRVCFVVEPIRRNLREQLAQRGVPICVACGYDLQQLASPRCPECGGRRSHRAGYAAGTGRGPSTADERG